MSAEMAARRTVYMLWHAHPTGAGEINEKLIGVYATEEDAKAARDGAATLAGFCETKEGFEIVPAVVGESSWEEGFITVG